MASPSLESFCCMRFEHNDTCSNNTFQLYDLKSINISYNVLCIVSSVMSICGASYQLTPRLPRRPPRSRSELESMLRQNVIICLLAIADLLASVGLSDLIVMNSCNSTYFGHCCLLRIWHWCYCKMLHIGHDYSDLLSWSRVGLVLVQTYVSYWSCHEEHLAKISSVLQNSAALQLGVFRHTINRDAQHQKVSNFCCIIKQGFRSWTNTVFFVNTEDTVGKILAVIYCSMKSSVQMYYVC